MNLNSNLRNASEKKTLSASKLLHSDTESICGANVMDFLMSPSSIVPCDVGGARCTRVEADSIQAKV